jgi:hypothetical protein
MCAYAIVHPIDQVNRSQSTNDVYPTVLALATIDAGRAASEASGVSPSRCSGVRTRPVTSSGPSAAAVRVACRAGGPVRRRLASGLLPGLGGECLARIDARSDGELQQHPGLCSREVAEEQRAGVGEAAAAAGAICGIHRSLPAA